MTELEDAGFSVETAPADLRYAMPRKWRLTIYEAGGEKATKDFMRTPRSDPKNHFPVSPTRMIGR